MCSLDICIKRQQETDSVAIKGPLHMSPADRAGPVSEISRAGSVPEISVFPIGISVSRLRESQNCCISRCLLRFSNFAPELVPRIFALFLISITGLKFLIWTQGETLESKRVRFDVKLLYYYIPQLKVHVSDFQLPGWKRIATLRKNGERVTFSF